MATDLFGRSTAYGLSTDGTFSYIWVERDSNWAVASDSTFFLDGSQLVIPGDDGVYDSYVLDTPYLAKQGTLSYDVFLPSMPTIDDSFPWIEIKLIWPDEMAFGDYFPLVFSIRTDYSFDPSVDPRVLAGFFFNGNTLRDEGGNLVEPISVPVDTGNWYTVKASYDITARAIGIKFWKRSDTEPTDYLQTYRTNEDWVRTESAWGDGYDGKPYLDFYFAGSVVSYFDNLTTGTFEDIPRSFSAHAVIGDGSKTGSFTAKALVVGQMPFRVCETFTATTAYGLGPEFPWIHPGYDTIGDFSLRGQDQDPTVAVTHLDGSQIVVGLRPGGTRNIAYTLKGSRERTGWTQFDFYVPADWYSGFPFISAVLSRGRTYTTGVWVGAYSTSATAAQWLLAIRDNTSTYVQYTFLPTPSTWYTARLFYDDVTGLSQALVKPQGSADSAAVVRTGEQVTNQTAFVGDHGDRFVFVTSTNGFPTTYVDNLCWLSTRLTADALIIGTVSSSFAANAVVGVVPITAKAVIKRTQVRSLTANAFLQHQYFRADAFIKDLNLLRHRYYDDHRGTIEDTQVVLDAPIAGYPIGTTLREVLVRVWGWASERH